MAARELGVKGRRREREVAEEITTTTVKRRKLEEEVESRIMFSPCGGFLARNSAGASETSVVIVRRLDYPIEEQCKNQTSECDDLLDRSSSSVACCSSPRLLEQQEESVAMEIQEVESRRRLSMKVKKKKKKKKSCETVKETELEGFFQAAEKDLRNKMLECSKKYNFDFEKDEPLGGRYEWVKLNP